MRLLILIFSVFVVAMCNCHGQKLNCGGPKTATDKCVCKNKALRQLDKFTQHLYQKAIEFSDNPEQIKRSHQKWLESKAKVELIPEHDNNLRLENLYYHRLSQLWQPSEKLRQYMARSIFDKSQKIEQMWFLLAFTALWDHHEQVVDLFKGPLNEMMIHIKRIDITSDQVVVAFPEWQGDKDYVFLLLTKVRDRINIEQYSLPFPKEYNGLAASNLSRLRGDFEFDNQQKTITYRRIYKHIRKSNTAKDHECVWKLTVDGPVLVSYKELDHWP